MRYCVTASADAEDLLHSMRCGRLQHVQRRSMRGVTDTTLTIFAGSLFPCARGSAVDSYEHADAKIALMRALGSGCDSAGHAASKATL